MFIEVNKYCYKENPVGVFYDYEKTEKMYINADCIKFIKESAYGSILFVSFDGENFLVKETPKELLKYLGEDK